MLSNSALQIVRDTNVGSLVFLHGHKDVHITLFIQYLSAFLCFLRPFQHTMLDFHALTCAYIDKCAAQKIQKP
jgi:hypothetical protein